MGGSSSSSQTSQTVENKTLEGTVTANVAPVFQGQDVQYNAEFGPEVAGAFGRLVDLTKSTQESAGNLIAQTFQGLFQLANDSLHSTVDISKTSTQEIQQANDRAVNPNLASTAQFIPLAIVALVGGIAYLIWGRK